MFENALDFPTAAMAGEARAIGAAGGDSRDVEIFDELFPALAHGLDVREFFPRLCTAASRIVPHDDASLVLRTDDPPAVDLAEPMLLEDLATDERGLRSGLAVPVRIGDQFLGVFTLRSRRPRAYVRRDLEHAQHLSRIIALAISHQQLAERARDAALEQQRAASIETSVELLRTIADVLDIRSVFPRVSGIANRMLPHDAMAMVFFDPDGKIAVQAASTPEFPDLERPLIARRPLMSDYVLGDLAAEESPVARGPNPSERLVAAGYRSAICVFARARDQIMSVSFLSKRLHAFQQRDFPVARRIADYIVLAVSHEQLADAARQVAEARARADRLEARVQMLAEELDAKTHARVVGRSPEWLDVLKKGTQVAATDTTVLVSGESGTGKEVVARFIHRASGRSNGPFVALNCAALPEQLLESELFGYERGAFTSAQQSKPGQIELAAGGVLFLDEVSEMSLSAQAKFLRVLQEREFQRLGGTRLLKANIRVVAATNRDLRKAVERGDFREDLFYRLQVFDIRIPPLRERVSDILPLADAFLKDIGKSFGRPPAGLTAHAREALLAYAWPGNVRELHNALERAAIVAEGGLIHEQHLALQGTLKASPSTTNLVVAERETIAKVLRETRWNKSEAAKRLGLTRSKLYVRMKKYGLEDPPSIA
jgi:transcriptional regulator with GAF, ATPase, and Fis domain